MIQYWRSKIKVTHKRATVIFENAFTLIHLKQKEEF